MKRVILLALALVACGFAADTARAADQEITCVGGNDCDTKMRRALRWVMDNSVYPITEQSDTTISTLTRLPFGSTDLIFTVTKQPTGYGHSNTFVLNFKAGCGTFFGGCRPTIQEAQASFDRYVSGGAALPGAIVQTQPGGGTAETSTKLICKGGGAMSIKLDYQNNANTGRPNQLVFELHFQPAAAAANPQPRAAGQCTLADRALKPGEPPRIAMAGSAEKIGLALDLTADRHVSDIAVQGSGGLHDGVSDFLNAALSGKEFTAEVTNIGNQQWEVTGKYAY